MQNLTENREMSVRALKFHSKTASRCWQRITHKSRLSLKKINKNLSVKSVVFSRRFMKWNATILVAFFSIYTNWPNTISPY